MESRLNRVLHVFNVLGTGTCVNSSRFRTRLLLAGQDGHLKQMTEVSPASSVEQQFRQLQQRLNAIHLRAEKMGGLAERYRGPSNRRTEEKNQAELKETLEAAKKEIIEAKAALDAISVEYQKAIADFQKQTAALQVR